MKLTQVSSLFRIEEFHILIDQGVVEVTSQVLCDPLTYQVVEVASDKYADGLTLYFNLFSGYVILRETYQTWYKKMFAKFTYHYDQS